MKQTILIFALSRSPWIGGIYYRKNIIHMLLENEDITKKYEIALLVNERYAEIFEVFLPEIKLIRCKDDIGVAGAILRSITCCMKYKVRYVFPLRPFGFLRMFGITPVSWIADLQHCHYPDFFDQEEIDKRNADFRQIARADAPLVLSSNDALKDFRTYFSSDRKNVFVVHFTSYIEDELKGLEKLDEDALLDRSGLKKGRYVAICNQFWKHKDHLVVLKAIKQLVQEEAISGMSFVFTGELSDRRDPAYIEQVRAMLDEPMIADAVKVLGFIDRTTQLCIMKNASFLIQPSLFEGWGTVVEDGKILNKRMILSDIDVHLEQKDDHCMLFKKNNPEALADAIKEMLSSRTDESLCEHIDMTRRYASVLSQIFI